MVSHVRLKSLHSHAAARKIASSSHAGDVLAQEVWKYVTDAPAIIVDVRTAPEWKFSGIPNMNGTHGKLATISWVRYPDFDANPAFISDIQQAAPDKEHPIFFLCKTGGRSHQAANVVAALGYSQCYNILHGFEGDANDARQRGKINGWKAAGLPWTQA
jgi:rhodanese-related sulfurtransferase